MSDKKWREFWINDLHYEKFEHNGKLCKQFNCVFEGHNVSPKSSIKVIEYAAYQELERKLEIAIDTMEYSSAQLILYSKTKSWAHLDHALMRMQKALKELEGK